MEGDEIVVVLSRASELRSKINNCIDKATKHSKRELVFEEEEDEEEEVDRVSLIVNPDFHLLHRKKTEEEESESLLNIRDALESLEEQLSCLQALQHQQRYEREVTLAQIDQSRKILLKKLKEYKGEDLEVINEASAFAGETVEPNDDLLLPPYPSRLLEDTLIPDDICSVKLPSLHTKFTRNGIINDGRHEAKKNMGESEKQTQTGAKNSTSRVKLLLGVAAKAVLTLVSVISALSIAGFEPRLIKRTAQFKPLDLFQKPEVEEKQDPVQCPSGKVLVIEDGKPRCLVKERVEVPFDPVVKAPNVSYGFG